MPNYPINFNEFRSILCLDGELPSADFFTTSLPIIAADGAANKLMQMHITPTLVIGDLDSVVPEYLAKINSHLHYDQNFCDFEKALMYLEEQNLLPCVIVGVNGGVLDHILNNINIFMREGNFFYAPPLCGYALHAGQQRIFSLALNTKISIMGLPHASVSSSGLKWELKQMEMTFPGKNSCFNRNVQAQVVLDVHEGCALILVYQ